MKNFAKLLLPAAALYLTGCGSPTAEKSAEITAMDTTYRPLYHFTTDSNWINDPNGLVYADGEFHLFAQYNPFGDKWGHMSWAHATSNDLFSWKQQALAIPEQMNADSSTTMIFSGSAVTDSFNTSGFGSREVAPMVAIYTSHIDKSGQGLAQSQSICYSLDKGKTWQQYKGNPVLDIHLKDFRDPKVFWYAAQKKWVMAVVKAVEYKVQFYESPDIIHWKYMSEFYGLGNRDKIWECPDLFQLPVEGTGTKKWVLTLSAGHPQKGYLAVQYFIGNFDGNKFTADALPYPLYIDEGKDFYAGVTYNNIPASDGRTIMIGWANCWNYANDIPTKGFRGMYTVPRALSLVQTAAGLRLKQFPVNEIASHSENIYSEKELSLDNNTIVLPVSGNALDISFTLQCDANTRVGINLLKSGNEQTTIKYDPGAAMVYLDRRASGDTAFNASFPGIDSVSIPAGTKEITFRVLVDNSIVELFVNDGTCVMTDLVFPKENNGNIELFSSGGKSRFSQVTINRVKKTMH